MSALEPIVRSWYWAPSEGPGLEHCRLDTDRADDCYVAHGLVLGVERDGRNKGKPFRLVYKVKADANWRTRKVTMESQSGDAAPITRILRSDGKGNWKDERGDALEPAKGCLDIDIWATPLTNTLPIRRLGLKPGPRESIRVVWVTGPISACAMPRSITPPSMRAARSSRTAKAVSAPSSRSMPTGS